MKAIFFTKYYRVFKNDTAITTVFVNNFKPGSRVSFKQRDTQLEDTLCSIPSSYSLPPDAEMFYGYKTLTEAMKGAKKGALLYINTLIKNVDLHIKILKQYRTDHYDDLNINLIDANIQRIETEINNK